MDIIVARLRRKRKNIYCLYIAYVFCLAACMVAFYFQQTLASFAVVLCLLFYFFIVRSSIKQYKTQVRECCISWNMEKSLTNTEFNPLPKVNIDEINVWKLLPPAKKGEYLIRDCVTGKASDVVFALFDKASLFQIRQRAPHCAWGIAQINGNGTDGREAAFVLVRAVLEVHVHTDSPMRQIGGVD